MHDSSGLPAIETALAGSRISIASADVEGRYMWVFNPPAELARDVAGLNELDVLPRKAGEILAAARQAVLASGETRDLEVEISWPTGSRWYDFSVRRQNDPSGVPTGTVASAIDITDRKVQEEHLRIVLRELAHRSKNLLAVIQGIARQTAESAASTQQFVSRFNGRIYSLSRAHDVLTDADWRGARIFDLVRSQIALYAEERLASVSMGGENGFLRPNAAQYIGLALHELTTNAIKYGALSRNDGQIAVEFAQVSPDAPSYRFSWKEKSTAEIREPRGRSFGLMMLTEVVPVSVSGTAELSFSDGGLSYHLDVPKAQLLT